MNAFRHWVLSLIAVLAFIGCESIDRVSATNFEPLKTEDGYAYFRFRAFGDAVYPEGSASAEASRMRMLEEWLAINGYPQAKYEVLTRRTVLRNKGLLGQVHDIYYDIRVPVR